MSPRTTTREDGVIFLPTRKDGGIFLPWSLVCYTRLGVVGSTVVRILVPDVGTPTPSYSLEHRAGRPSVVRLLAFSSVDLTPPPRASRFCRPPVDKRRKNTTHTRTAETRTGGQIGGQIRSSDAGGGGGGSLPSGALREMVLVVGLARGRYLGAPACKRWKESARRIAGKG